MGKAAVGHMLDYGVTANVHVELGVVGMVDTKLVAGKCKVTRGAVGDMSRS